VYYTLAYASYKKEAIENANRLVRRLHKKCTLTNNIPQNEIYTKEKITWQYDH
jgi:IS30 family transposase